MSGHSNDRRIDYRTRLRRRRFHLEKVSRERLERIETGVRYLTTPLANDADGALKTEESHGPLDHWLGHLIFNQDNRVQFPGGLHGLSSSV